MNKEDICKLYLDYLNEVRNINHDNKRNYYLENYKNLFYDLGHNYIDINNDQDKKFLIDVGYFMLENCIYDEVNLSIFDSLKYEDNKQFWEDNYKKFNLKGDTVVKLLLDNSKFVETNLSMYNDKFFQNLVEQNKSNLNRENMIDILSAKFLNRIGKDFIRKEISQHKDLFSNFNDVFYLFKERLGVENVNNFLSNVNCSAYLNISEEKLLFMKNENNETVLELLLKKNHISKKICNFLSKNKKFLQPDININSFIYLLDKKEDLESHEVEFLSAFLPRLSKFSMEKLNKDGDSLILKSCFRKNNLKKFLGLQKTQGSLFNKASIKNKKTLNIDSGIQLNISILFYLSLSSINEDLIKINHIENLKNKLSDLNPLSKIIRQDLTIFSDSIRNKLTNQIFSDVDEHNIKIVEKKKTSRLRL